MSTLSIPNTGNKINDNSPEPASSTATIRPTMNTPSPDLISRAIKVDQTHYLTVLRNSKELRKIARAYIEEKWWTPLCQSANNTAFYPILFDSHLFSNEGVLDFSSPAYAKIKQSLVSSYPLATEWHKG